MAIHLNSNGLKYELNILEHDSDYYDHSKVKVVSTGKRPIGIPFKALINIVLMAIVGIIAVAVLAKIW